MKTLMNFMFIYFFKLNTTETARLEYKTAQIACSVEKMQQ